MWGTTVLNKERKRLLACVSVNSPLDEAVTMAAHDEQVGGHLGGGDCQWPGDASGSSILWYRWSRAWEQTSWPRISVADSGAHTGAGSWGLRIPACLFHARPLFSPETLAPCGTPRVYNFGEISPKFPKYRLFHWGPKFFCIGQNFSVKFIFHSKITPNHTKMTLHII